VKNNIEKKDDYHYCLHKWLFYSEMLAEQCNTWLSAEEGNENMMQHIRESGKLIINKHCLT